MKDYTNYSLLPYNTFGMDVKAARFVEYESVNELLCFLKEWKAQKTPLLHVGRGSNLLFVSDYQGTVLHSGIKGMQVVSETDEWVEIRVGAGEVWDDFVDYTVKQGWYGAENLSLIPGEVGASAVQNIGAYGVEAKDLIVSVETVAVNDGTARLFKQDECGYAYRESVFKRELKGLYIVTYVTYRLKKQPEFHLDYGNIRSELEKEGGELSLEKLRHVIIRIREAKLPDPEKIGNAGSFFMNPIVPREKLEALQQEFPRIPFYELNDGRVKIPAGWMIDQCGWKGKALGPAAVHDKQALVLVNRGGAKGSDVLALSDAVRASVRAKFGIDIHPEVNLVGK